MDNEDYILRCPHCQTINIKLADHKNDMDIYGKAEYIANRGLRSDLAVYD